MTWKALFSGPKGPDTDSFSAPDWLDLRFISSCRVLKLTFASVSGGLDVISICPISDVQELIFDVAASILFAAFDPFLFLQAAKDAFPDGP